MSSFPPFIYPQKKLPFPLSCFSVIYVFSSKNFQKNSCLYLDHIEISSTFAPAFQEMVSLEIDILTATVYELNQISSLCPSFLSKVGHWKKKNEKKLPKTFGRYAIKFLPLHPLSERKRSSDWQLEQKRGALNFVSFIIFYLPFAKRDDEKKKKKKKNFRKYLEDILESPYLCSRFLKRKSVSITKRSLRNLHKQYK